MTRSILVAAGAGLALLAIALVAFSLYRSRAIEAKYPPVGRFTEAGGVNFHYVDRLPAVPDDASTPALVFIHGASGNLRDPLMAFAPALEGRHRLIFVDRPGHGWSSRGKNPDMASPAAQADAIRALLDRIGVRRAVIVGHSWGGAVAAAFGVNHPDVTAGIVFLAPASHPWPGGVAWYQTVAAQPYLGTLFARTLVMPVGHVALESGLQEVFRPNAEPAGYMERAAVPLLFRPSEFVANAEDVFRLNDNLATLQPRYREITAPVAILSGNQDAIVYEELHSGGLARDIPGARLIWLDGVGHMPHHAATDRVVSVVEEVANLARGRALAGL